MKIKICLSLAFLALGVTKASSSDDRSYNMINRARVFSESLLQQPIYRDCELQYVAEPMTHRSHGIFFLPQNHEDITNKICQEWFGYYGEEKEDNVQPSYESEAFDRCDAILDETGATVFQLSIVSSYYSAQIRYNFNKYNHDHNILQSRAWLPPSTDSVLYIGAFHQAECNDRPPFFADSIAFINTIFNFLNDAIVPLTNCVYPSLPDCVYPFKFSNMACDIPDGPRHVEFTTYCVNANKGAPNVALEILAKLHPLVWELEDVTRVLVRGYKDMIKVGFWIRN